MQNDFKIPIIHVDPPQYRCQDKKILEEVRCAPINPNALPILHITRGFEDEGSLIGQPQARIIIGGCAVGRKDCQPQSDIGAAASRVMSIAEIIVELYKIGADKIKTVVISEGDSPQYRTQTAALSNALKDNGWNTHLETSGFLIDTKYYNWFNYISIAIKTTYSTAPSDNKHIRKIIEYSMLTPQPHQIKARVSCVEDLQWIEEKFRPLLLQKERPLIITTQTEDTTAFDLVQDWIRPEYNVRVIASQHVILKQR